MWIYPSPKMAKEIVKFELTGPFIYSTEGSECKD